MKEKITEAEQIKGRNTTAEIKVIQKMVVVELHQKITLSRSKASNNDNSNNDWKMSEIRRRGKEYNDLRGKTERKQVNETNNSGNK